MTQTAPIIEGTGKTLEQLSEATQRSHRLILKGRPADLRVYRLPVKYLYFNIENGRYADRMMRIKAEHPGEVIDARSPEWRKKIRDTLMARGKMSDPRDKTASARLMEDIRERSQIVPGIVAEDGGVLDGNRRLAVLIELHIEHFDGVIIPQDTSREDLWRIEAGAQMGRSLIHAYSPINELLKIREGLGLFRDLKKKGQDPAPDRTPEQLVSDTLYGIEPSEVQESIERIELIEQYLVFIGTPKRFDLIGERAERFKEAVKVVRAARNQGWDPDMAAKLKAFVFNQILTEKLENWDIRDIYRAIGGDPKSRGKKAAPLPRSQKLLLDNLPAVEEMKEASRAYAAAHEQVTTVELDKKTEETIRKAESLSEDFLHAAEEEGRQVEPLKLLSEVLASMERIELEKARLAKNDNKSRALKIVEKIEKIAGKLRLVLEK